jgi:hypothetical protein
VELVQPDRLDPERPQRRLARRAQVLAAAVQRPRAVRRAGVAALGRDEDLVAVARPARQRPGQQALVVADLVRTEAVRVGGVEQGDARVERGVHRAHGLGLVGPALDGQGHGPEADRADGTGAERALLHVSSRGQVPPALPLVARPQPLGDDGVSSRARVTCVPLGRWRTSRAAREERTWA